MLFALSLLVVAVVHSANAGYCHRPDLDCAGNDIRSFAADTAACQQACDDEPNCKSIQSLKGTCWLKNKACDGTELRVYLEANDYVKFDGKCKKSAYGKPTNKYCHRDQSDCAGHDISTFKASSLKQCQDLCDFNPNCKSIQYLEDGNCWLKNYACDTNELRPYNTGNDYVKIDRKAKCGKYKRPSTKYCARLGQDCMGHDIHHVNWAKSVDDCQMLCDYNTDCLSIQYRDNDCWLKNHVCDNNELRAMPKYADFVKVKKGGSCADYKVAGVYRYCERAGKDCMGHDKESFKVDTLEECEDRCSFLDDCKSIQYIQPNCWIKNHACKDGELRDYEGGRDHVKIPRTSNCNKEMPKYA